MGVGWLPLRGESRRASIGSQLAMCLKSSHNVHGRYKRASQGHALSASPAHCDFDSFVAFVKAALERQNAFSSAANSTSCLLACSDIMILGLGASKFKLTAYF